MVNFKTVGLPVEDIETCPSRRKKGSQRWYTTPAGIEYPSITTVLSHGDKPWLTNWRNMLGEKKADAETKRTSERGTAVHSMIEGYLQNIENPTKGFKADHSKLFNQVKVRLNKINNIRAQEIALYSDTMRIAGTADVIAEYDGVLSVIDFKTSNNNKDDEMVFDYCLQCTAYSLMYYEMYGEQIDDIVLIVAVERGMVPMLYRKKAADYIMPLVERINTFYSDNAGKAK